MSIFVWDVPISLSGLQAEPWQYRSNSCTGAATFGLNLYLQAACVFPRKIRAGLQTGISPDSEGGLHFRAHSA